MVLAKPKVGYGRGRAPLRAKRRKSPNIGPVGRTGSRPKGSHAGDDLVAAFEEMVRHLRGETELEAHEVRTGTMTPAQIRAIRLKVASSTKEFERLFGIPSRTVESYEQGRRNVDGAMRALLRIIDRERKAACRTHPAIISCGSLVVSVARTWSSWLNAQILKISLENFAADEAPGRFRQHRLSPDKTPRKGEPESSAVRA
jgi:DNA-binding transcriptional regulator YiaG